MDPNANPSVPPTTISSAHPAGHYLRTTSPLILTMELLRALLTAASSIAPLIVLKRVVASAGVHAPIHRQLIAHPTIIAVIYLLLLVSGAVLVTFWFTTALRNFVAIALRRANLNFAGREDDDKLSLPPWPFTRESFAIVLGELQDRDGARVPNDRSPHLRPRWLTISDEAIYTGFLITGAIGSGKTAGAIYTPMKQMIGFRRFVPVKKPDGSVEQLEWKFSGLITEEKGDFTDKAAEFCKYWGRQNDLIRITPGGDWIWNIVYNPNIATWAIGYQLGWILKNFNKGQTGSDPFWENAPRELVTEYLGLLDDAESYYTICDYLELLVADSKQNELYEKARIRHADDKSRLHYIDQRWASITRRRTGMGVNLRGSLEACARAGLDMFKQQELRRTFCPTKEEYFEIDSTGHLRPRANVFTGFDQILETGKIVGLEMPKQLYYDAAIFCQVALKTQWQDSVLRRDTRGPNGKLISPPRFGQRIGYCPTFIIADEAHFSVTPRDAEFKSVCRQKRASVWEACQSHNSIRSTFGPNKTADADAFFQNSLTRIYLRQSDPASMEIIQKEIGKKLIPKTTMSVTEGGNSSALSYSYGDIVHQGMGISSQKSVTTEEKPFLEIEELKALPNHVAIVSPSNGQRTLPATICYLRPLYVLEDKKHNIQPETSWFDWPEELRSTYDLETIPQEFIWQGWGTGPLDAVDLIQPDSRLGKFVQKPTPPIVVPPRPEPPLAAPEAVPEVQHPAEQPEVLGGPIAQIVPDSRPVTDDELTPIDEDDVAQLPLAPWGIDSFDPDDRL
jgi:TraM recognition site of TraD and TraG